MKIIKIILVVIFIISFNFSYANNIAQEDYYLHRYLNINSLSLSNTYRNLYQNNNKLDFISLFYDLKKVNIIKINELMNINNDVICENIYYGKDGFERNKREGLVCLQLLILAGHSEGALRLSRLYFNESNFELATFFYAVYKTLNNNEDFNYISKLKNSTVNFNEIYVNGLISGAKMYFLDFHIKDIGFDISIFDRKIKDERYNTKLNIKESYNYLKNNNYKDFIENKINEEVDGSRLFLLSAAAAGDFDKLSEYCFSMEDKLIAEYCLASLFNYNRNEKSLSRYFYIKMSKYPDNKEDIYRLIGLNSKDFIVNNVFKTKIKEYLLDHKSLEIMIRNYNYGRIISKNLK